MAFNSVEFDVVCGEVFAVLVDPTTYPDWLIGAADIRDVDEDWPIPRSCFHHRVGFGPFRMPDSTEVLAVEPNRMLQLAVRARPLVSAVVTFRLVGDGGRCVLTWQEEPASRVLGNLVRPVLDPLTHVRNHRSLGRLVGVVRERRRTTTRPESAGTSLLSS